MAGTGFTSGSDGTMSQVVKTDDILGNDPRIKNHRISVYHVYQRYVDNGETPEAIATSYGISVAEVHAALAYAFSNPGEMHDIEARNHTLTEESESYRLSPDESA